MTEPEGVWKGMANQWMVRKREESWYEGRDEREVEFAEAADKLAAEFEMHEGFIEGAGVSFQASKLSGAVDLSGAPKSGASPDPDWGLLRLSFGGGEEHVSAAYRGAMWLWRRCFARAAAFFDPAVGAPQEEDPPYRPSGASVSQVTKDAVEDFDKLAARAEADRQRHKSDADVLRAHYDRKRTYTFMLAAGAGNTSVTVDGRGLVCDVYLQRDQKLGQKVGWALRKAGLDARAWCEEALAPLLARVPSLGDVVPGFGEGLGLDLARGIKDWPDVADYETHQLREEFKHEVRLFRFSPWDVEKKQIERAKAQLAARREAEGL